MPLCYFSNNSHVFDITPVENLFIQEFMLKAPGDFVKAYLYGLKQCYHSSGSEDSLEDFAHALGMEKKTVENAFRYWERQGILKVNKTKENKFSVEYYNIKDVLYNRGGNAENILYKYKDFNQNLQLIFGNRLLTPQEYLKIYDWIEIFELPKEVILMMIRFYLSKVGPKVSINYLDKIAESWARDGINTLQKAEEYIKTSESCYQDTVAVLKYLGIKRMPSQAELELYKKWRDVWGFSLNAILQACKETTKTQSPNMAYLDKILENLHKAGLESSQEVSSYLASRESVNDKIKELFLHLGKKDISPTPEHQAFYLKWTREWELNHEVLVLACKHCVRKGVDASLQSLDNLLEKWVKLGLKTTEDIKKYLGQIRKMDNEIKEILERAGENRPVEPADRNALRLWTQDWGLPFELILLAAEYSVMAKDKLLFMNKILASWKAKNITTVKEAKEDHERHLRSMQQDQKKALSKQVDFNKFQQHSYSEEDLEYLYEDIENA